MNRRTIVEFAVFLALVSAGATLRVALQDIPNFAPVAALALFAGYFFRWRMVALALPLCIMAISDWQIERTYAWWQTAIVYGMLALPVFLRGTLRRHFQPTQKSWRGSLASVAGLLTCSLGGSIAFFIVTNGICLGWYEPTVAGVLHCYAAGLPFFKYTLAGDMGFALATFGSYAVAMSYFASRKSSGTDLQVRPSMQRDGALPIAN